jgi:two-component system chemotaxis sensor kinase CheA
VLQFDLDDDDLKLFCEEADEQLELLDASLVQLEGEPDPELLQQIFRAAHTLKGSSATIGHKKMASLTHAMETVLDALRQGRREPTSDLVDALLNALDALRVLSREVVTRVDSGTETVNLEADLLALLDGEPVARAAAAPRGFSLPESVREALGDAASAAGMGYVVHVEIDGSCAMPSIRCFQALQELDGLGRVIHTEPERAVIDSGGAEHTMVVVLVTAATEEQLHAAVTTISDTSARVEPAGEEAAAVGVTCEGGTPETAPAPARATPSGPRLAVVQDQLAADERRVGARSVSQSVRIDVERLDGLMNLVGELVIDRTRLQQIREQLAGVLKNANLTELTENFEETTSHLARITDELQEEIMRSRMLPVRSVLTRLPRLVRDVAAKCGKKVELVTAGEETELDRSVIEEISDPLAHILRNAIDHGIESPADRVAAGKPRTGTIWVTAWNQETYIYLSVRDDGRGIDTAALRARAVERGIVSAEAAQAASDEEALQYLFYAGVSTAKSLSDVSGRGVGMDIVRTNIERLNGQVLVRSMVGKGSEFVIQLPLTLATTKALMVTANGTVYALPLVSVTEALAEADADIHSLGGHRTLRLRGKLLPVVDLADALGDRRPRRVCGNRFVVAARHSDREVAFLVDRLLGEQDVVVKALGEVIGNHKGLTGATILGDGTLGLIIDSASLVAERTRLAAAVA